MRNNYWNVERILASSDPECHERWQAKQPKKIANYGEITKHPTSNVRYCIPQGRPRLCLGHSRGRPPQRPCDAPEDFWRPSAAASRLAKSMKAQHNTAQHSTTRYSAGMCLLENAKYIFLVFVGMCARMCLLQYDKHTYWKVVHSPRA